MILGGNPSAGSIGFPDPPTGSPGEIASIARGLSGAADDLERAQAGLHGASATLAADWQGYAAAAYHASSDGLAAVARGGAASFHDCARAVSGYASALDHAQSEIRRLRALYDTATTAEAAASSTLSGLQNKLTSATKPAEVTKLNNQISSAQSTAQNSAFDASGYARQATAILDEFNQTQSRYAQVLSGARLSPRGGPAPGSLFNPFEPAGAPGPGFGVPAAAGAIFPGLLASAYGGVIPVGDPWNSPIPGYGIYEDATTPEAVPTNDLTNAIALVAAPEAAGAVEGILGSGARTLAERFGIGAAERAVAQTAQGSVGLSGGALSSAFQGMRGGGGHAIRHLMDEGLIPNTGSLTSRVSQFEQLTTPILASPARAFDYTVGTTPARAFAGEAGGQRVVIFIAKSGPYRGRIISAIVPDASQAAGWGLK